VMKEYGAFVDMVIDLAAPANCFCVAMVYSDASICQNHQTIAHLFPLEKTTALPVSRGRGFAVLNGQAWHRISNAQGKLPKRATSTMSLREH
jgi:hypothetical protein